MDHDRLMPEEGQRIIEENLDGEEDHNPRDLDNGDAGDGDGDGDVEGEGDDDSELDDMQVMRLNNPQVAMLLDAPHEPPFDLHQILGPVAAPLRPRKKRSFLTISKPFHVQPQMCELIANGWQAVQHIQPEMRGEYFANYLYEHMNSKNYPNGEGLPHCWGQF